MILELAKPKRKRTVKKDYLSESKSIETGQSLTDSMLSRISKAKVAPAKASPAKSAAPKSYIEIDYPKTGDAILNPSHYAVRLGAGGGAPVEISIDGGDWQACRENSGYYWYDWHHIPAGKHKIAARIKTADGKYKKSKVTRCSVV